MHFYVATINIITRFSVCLFVWLFLLPNTVSITFLSLLSSLNYRNIKHTSVNKSITESFAEMNSNHYLVTGTPRDNSSNTGKDKTWSKHLKYFVELFKH